MAELVDLVASGDRVRSAKGGQAQNAMIYLYVIQSLNHNFRYVGITNNLEKRIEQHNRGYNISTKQYKPFKLLLSESFNDYKEARQREVFLKSGQGRKFLDSL